MNPHPRIRKTIKWGGAAVTVLLVVMWIIAPWWYWGYEHSHWIVGSESGRLVLGHDNFPSGDIQGGFMVQSWKEWTPWKWWFGLQVGRRSWWAYVPIWVPLAVSLPATFLAWRLDTLARRRAKLNLCPKCGYDRTGLAAGAVCPECGVERAAAGSGTLL